MRAHLLLAGLLVACGHQDGIVGVQPLGEAGAGSAGAAGATTLGFFDEFAANSGAWEEQTVVPGAVTSFGQKDATARDGNTAELRFPGHPEYGSSDQVGAHFATQIGSSERFHFGTYRSRLGFGSCDSSEDTVMAFLGYFNDGTDRDGDGIVDDVEIDMQVTCGAPSRMYLTVFTDYEESPQGVLFRKLSRVIDFADGSISDTVAPDSENFAAARSDAMLAIPGVVSSDALYELGFEWHADSIRFFMTIDGTERELWTLTGAERVPQLPVYIIYNMWHPDSHWYPRSNAADYPGSDVVMRVDWVSFEPE